MTQSSAFDRRGFLRQTTAAGSALALSAVSYGRVSGSNERINIAFLGCGGRGQAHIDIIQRLAREGQNLTIAGVCDVWNGLEEEYEQNIGGQKSRRKYLQGLIPTARKAGLDPKDRRRVTKDYRRLLDLPEVDTVCISTPDHWHARMVLDAVSAGKSVYCERPLARTVSETVSILDTLAKANVPVNVGLQTLSDPSWLKARELIQSGRLGHVAQAQTHFFRNDIRGYGRYYRLVEEMTPGTIDWPRFTGKENMPFDRAKFAQWRCYEAFGSGPFVDLLQPQIARMMLAMNVKMPRRVAGLGGLFLEHDGREIPDLATLVVDFEEGCQLTATACSIGSYPNEEIIRGRFGAIRFTSRGLDLFAEDPRSSKNPNRLGDRPVAPTEAIAINKPGNETLAMWQHFLECVRTQSKETLCPPDLAGTAGIVALMAAESLKTGQMLAWDSENRKVILATEARAKTSTRKLTDLQPPEYMKLAGDWKNGIDPAKPIG